MIEIVAVCDKCACDLNSKRHMYFFFKFGLIILQFYWSKVRYNTLRCDSLFNYVIVGTHEMKRVIGVGLEGYGNRKWWSNIVL